MIEKVATLHEIETKWCLNDVAIACKLLDAKQAVIGILLEDIGKPDGK